MRKNNKLWFTLVELLVVITILAIISVVAYQNFGWAVDKAVWGRKISDISTIETALQQYKSENNYYPPTDSSGTTNMWGYDTSKMATPSNIIKVDYDWSALSWVTLANWWWKVFGTWAWAHSSDWKQIWAKWTISQNTLWKKYLSKDLYDPELWDVITSSDWKKLIEKWIGRYVYATFKKNTWSWSWSSNFNWNAYNIAYTVRKDWSDTYMTKIVWDYDKASCYIDSGFCPDTLIWSWTVILTDKEEQNWSSELVNYHIPYAVTDFKSAP